MEEELIDFATSIKRAGSKKPTLLIGNGFSAKYFNYDDLLEASKLKKGTPLRKLFGALETVDFEKVVRALEGAEKVADAYGETERKEKLCADAQKVREALVRVINHRHPKHRDYLGMQYESSAAFLKKFSNVFTLNYDLLLYWVNLENCILTKGLHVSPVHRQHVDYK